MGPKKTNYLIHGFSSLFLFQDYSTARIIDTSFSNHASRKREKKYKESDGIEKQ